MAQAVSTLTPYTTRRKPQRLRELGIYELPDGRQYVVSTLYADGCSLYCVRAREGHGNTEFRPGVEGRLLRRDVPTRPDHPRPQTPASCWTPPQDRRPGSVDTEHCGRPADLCIYLRA